MKNELEKKVKISDIILSNNIYISLIIFAVAFIICAVCVPNILLPSNIISVLRMNSISGIVAIGMTLVMLTGEIDLSVGAIMSLSLAVGSKVIEAGQPGAALLLSLIHILRNSKKAPGQERIYTAGEKEYQAWQERKDKGVPVGEAVQKEFVEIRDRYGLPYKFPFES